MGKSDVGDKGTNVDDVMRKIKYDKQSMPQPKQRIHQTARQKGMRYMKQKTAKNGNISTRTGIFKIITIL